MRKKFINTGNFRLAYFEIRTSVKKTIFFIHGNSGSHRSWHNQFESPLFEHYRLVTIELPGHGQSSDSENPWRDYSPVVTGELMAMAVKKLLTGDEYGLVGFSYGTNLIAEILNYGVKPKGLALIGSCIAGAEAGPEQILQDPSSIYFHDNILPGDAKKFLTARIKCSGSSTIYLEDYFYTRKPFRSALMQAAVEGKYLDEIELLRKLNIPVLVVFGKSDDLVFPNYLDNISLNYWSNTIYKLKDAGHFVHEDEPEACNKLMLEYSNGCIR